jgi:hypothetical protein
MIRRTSKSLTGKILAATALAGFAGYANAGPSTVTPALAACSKALIESIAKADTLPAYKVKAPALFLSDTVDPNAYTVVARSGKSRTLLAKASCKATPSGEIVSFKSIPLKSS